MTKLLQIIASLLLILFLLTGYMRYVQHSNIRNDHDYNEFESTNSAKVNKNTYKIFVDVESSNLYLFENGNLIKTYPCSGGTAQTPSPIGTWTIISKDTWGEGFGGRWMGFNVPWGNFGIHGTIFPNSIGWNSSHGCIRMYNKDVKELYNIIPHGTQVTIEDGCYGKFGRGIRSLEPGDYGADVMEIQKKLKELDLYRSSIDGTYGDGMKAAVHNFQRANKLPISNTISKKMIQQLGFFEFE